MLNETYKIVAWLNHILSQSNDFGYSTIVPKIEIHHDDDMCMV